MFDYNETPALLRAHGKCSPRQWEGGTAELFQFWLVTVLQHKQSPAVLSTEGAGRLQEYFFCFHNLISSVSQDYTCQSFLSSAFWTAVIHISYFCFIFCIFLPLSVIFQVLLFTDTWSHKSVTPLSTPLQTNPAYFPWHVSILFFPPWSRTSESRLVFHCF